MNIKRWLSLLLTGLLLLSLGACKSTDKPKASSSAPQKEIDPNYPVSIGDIRVPQRPEAVVSLSPALTEVICELGARDRLAGVSDFCDYPKNVADAARCGTPQLPKLDEIETLQPAVVFTSSALSQANTIKLQQMGAEVIVLPHAASIDQLDELYNVIGTVLDGMLKGDQNAKAIFSPLRTTYDALCAAAQQVTPVPAIYLRALPLTMATGDTFEGKLLEQLGFTNAAADCTAWNYPADQAAALYPAVIFYDESISTDSLKANKVYNTTDAVKENRLYPIDGLALERQSARFFEALRAMFEQANPDIKLDLTAVPQPESKQEEPSSAPQKENSASAEDDEDVLTLDDATKVKS